MFKSTCDRLELLYPAFLDGNATPKEEAHIVKHLKTCTRCRHSLQLTRHAMRFGDAYEEIPPVGFRQRLFSRLRAETLAQQDELLSFDDDSVS